MLSRGAEKSPAQVRELSTPFEGTRQLKFKLSPGTRDQRDIIYTSASNTPVNNSI